MFNDASTKRVHAGFFFCAAAAPEPCKILLLFSRFGSLLSSDCQIVQIPPLFDYVCEYLATAPSFLHLVLEGNSLPSCPLLDAVSTWITVIFEIPSKSIPCYGLE